MSTIDVAHLRENYDPSEMQKLDVYPIIWSEENGEVFEYIAEYFLKLQVFLAECAKRELGVAVYLS